MSGLLSKTPSPGSVRLALGGYVLLFVQTYLMMLAPGVMERLGLMIWIVTFVSGASLIGALVGPPDPPSTHWRRRHDR